MELFSESTNDPSLEMEATGAVPYLKELFKNYLYYIDVDQKLSVELYRLIDPLS